MTMQDPVADMLTRIRNAQAMHKVTVAIPMSKLKESIANVLQEEGYIKGFKVEGEKPSRLLVVDLKYDENDKPVITTIQRKSRPGLRVYAGVEDLPKVLNGLGIAVVSTPKGVMSDRKARLAGQGGEIICYVT